MRAWHRDGAALHCPWKVLENPSVPLHFVPRVTRATGPVSWISLMVVRLRWHLPTQRHIGILQIRPNTPRRREIETLRLLVSRVREIHFLWPARRRLWRRRVSLARLAE